MRILKIRWWLWALLIAALAVLIYFINIFHPQLFQFEKFKASPEPQPEQVGQAEVLGCELQKPYTIRREWPGREFDPEDIWCGDKISGMVVTKIAPPYGKKIPISLKEGIDSNGKYISRAYEITFEGAKVVFGNYEKGAAFSTDGWTFVLDSSDLPVEVQAQSSYSNSFCILPPSDLDLGISGVATIEIRKMKIINYPVDGCSPNVEEAIVLENISIDTKTYTNQDFGFSFEYPVYYSVSRTANHAFDNGVSLYLDDPRDHRPNMYVTVLSSDVASFVGRDGSEAMITIGALTGKKYTLNTDATAFPNIGSGDSSYIFLLNSGHEIAFTYSSKISEHDEAAFQDIIQSLKQ